MGVLCACGLWLLFVIDYWNNTISYNSLFPANLSFLRWSNAPYLISAGLPAAAFFLLCVLPDTLGRIIPGYRVWNKRCLTAVAVVLTAMTLLMFSSTWLYVEMGISYVLFGYNYRPGLRTMTMCYVLSGAVFLVLSAVVWLTGKAFSLQRMNRTALRTGCVNTAGTAFWCVVLGLVMTVISCLILNLLSALKFYSAVNYVDYFCKNNANNFRAAMVSLISAPIVEEIAFRGILCKGLKKTSGNSWIAILISALFFGLWHRNLGQFAYTFAVGVLLGYVFLRSHSVFWPMLVHFSINLLAILAYSNNRYNVFGAWPVLYRTREWLSGLPLIVSVVGLAILIEAARCICVRIREINK